MGKIYFASDFHLGSPNLEQSQERERKIVRWLDIIEKDAEALYLVGDIFDFWFEYKTVVPRGYIRLLGKLAQFKDKGIAVYFFTGNHDMWMFNYFEEELGIPVFREPVIHELKGKRFYIGHGDGLGPGDHSYKLIKRVFANPLCQWLFARLHPNLGITLANLWSRKSRKSQPSENPYLGDDKEWLFIYAEEILQKEHFDYFIFGHRHLPIDRPLKDGNSRYVNLGDWLKSFSYAEFDGQELALKYFEQ